MEGFLICYAVIGFSMAVVARAQGVSIPACFLLWAIAPSVFVVLAIGEIAAAIFGEGGRDDG